MIAFLRPIHDWLRSVRRGTLVLSIVLIGVLAVIIALVGVQRQVEQEITRDHNALVCVTRKYLLASRDRAYFIVNDPNASEVAKINAIKSISATDTFLDGLITVPHNHVCHYKKEKHVELPKHS